MSTQPREIEQRPPAGNSGFLLGFARVFWTILGPLLLLGALIQNVVNPGGWFGGWDAAVILILGAMIGCRGLEQSTGGATTAYGEPSTPEHFRRYAIVMVSVTVAAWILANVVGNHVLR